jgi:hypothetical protein
MVVYDCGSVAVLDGTCTSTVPGWPRAGFGAARVTVTVVNPVKTDVMVVYDWDDIATLDGTWISTVPGRPSTASGSARVVVTVVEPV